MDCLYLPMNALNQYISNKLLFGTAHIYKLLLGIAHINKWTRPLWSPYCPMNPPNLNICYWLLSGETLLSKKFAPFPRYMLQVIIWYYPLCLTNPLFPEICQKVRVKILLYLCYSKYMKEGREICEPQPYREEWRRFPYQLKWWRSAEN